MNSNNTMVAAAVALVLSLVPTAASAGRDFAEASYNDGIELMNKGDAYRAISKFEYAIQSAARKKAPKAKYFFKLCEAHVVTVDRHGEQYWDGLVKSCDDAVGKTSGNMQNKARALRKKLGVALGNSAAAKGKERLERSDHRAAQKWYRRAVQYNPRPSYYGILCRSESTSGASGAKASCQRAASLLTGDSKKRAQALARQAGDKPNAAQQKKIAELEKTTTWGDALHRDLEMARKCIAQVNAARAAGVKPHHRVMVDDDFPNAIEVANPGRTPNYYLPFEKIAPYCNKGLAAILAVPVKRALESAVYWDKAVDKAVEDTDFVTMGPTVAKCRKAIADAQKSGLSADTVIEYSGSKVKLGEADAKVCTAFENRFTARRAEIRAKAEAERQAKLAPYKKVLKRDKWKLYEKYGLDTWFQGRGGAKLKTPADHRKAKKWFLTSVGRDRRNGLKTWRLTIFVFRGHKLRKTQVKEGYGNVPSKAFR